MSNDEASTTEPDEDVRRSLGEALAGPVAQLRRIADQDIGGNAPWLADKLHGFADQLAAEMRGECQMDPSPAMPPPVADFGPVRLELMGHRYREGNLSEVVIAGQPFLRLEPEGGAAEYYRPDAVYCLTPGASRPTPPRAAIPERFGDVLEADTYDDDDGDDNRSW